MSYRTREQQPEAPKSGKKDSAFAFNTFNTFNTAIRKPTNLYRFWLSLDMRTHA